MYRYVILFLLLVGVTLYVMSPRDPVPLVGAPTPQYYLEQAYAYFDTIDFFVFKGGAPHYAKDVIRWEWHPWLLLTGYGARSMQLDVLQKLYPTRITNRNCTVSEVAPQVRCSVSFAYLGHTNTTDIYEEFTFNELGEITFIEAWSETPEVRAQRDAGTLKRMSVISLDAQSQDPDVLDLRNRMKHPLYWWFCEAWRFVFSFIKL